MNKKNENNKLILGIIFLICIIFLLGMSVGIVYTANDMKKIYKDYDVKVTHHNMSKDFEYCPYCGEKLIRESEE